MVSNGADGQGDEGGDDDDDDDDDDVDDMDMSEFLPAALLVGKFRDRQVSRAPIDAYARALADEEVRRERKRADSEAARCVDTYRQPVSNRVILSFFQLGLIADFSLCLILYCSWFDNLPHSCGFDAFVFHIALYCLHLCLSTG